MNPSFRNYNWLEPHDKHPMKPSVSSALRGKERALLLLPSCCSSFVAQLGSNTQGGGKNKNCICILFRFTNYRSTQVILKKNETKRKNTLKNEFKYGEMSPDVLPQ